MAGYSGIQPKSQSATLTNVASSASNVTLFSSNDNAEARMIFNDADVAVCVKFGSTATTSSFTVKIAAGGYYEFPQPVYTGRVDAIWVSSPTGSARVTEQG